VTPSVSRYARSPALKAVRPLVPAVRLAHYGGCLVFVVVSAPLSLSRARPPRPSFSSLLRPYRRASAALVNAMLP